MIDRSVINDSARLELLQHGIQTSRFPTRARVDWSAEVLLELRLQPQHRQ